MSDIRTKIEMDTKDICSIIENLTSEFKQMISTGNTSDLNVADKMADMIKNFADAKKNIVEAQYKEQIILAMDNAERGEYLVPTWGDSKNMTPHFDYYRDMDRGAGRMYYTEPTHMDVREGRAHRSRVRFYESKEKHSSGSSEDRQANMKSLEDYLADVSKDVTEMIENASPEERQMVRSKMVGIANVIG